jgi:hypothetical protein
MSQLVFTVVDPRSVSIRLTKACWQQHILKFHPIMRGQLAKVKATLTDPDAIYQSKRNKDSHLYFKSYAGLPAGNQYVLVVVDSRRSYVQTSFPVHTLSKGGQRLWKKS